MKKIIILFSLLIAFVAIQAQDFGLTSNNTYVAYTGTATDLVAGTASLSKTVKINKIYLYYYDVVVDIDTTSGGGSEPVSCILAGSNDNVNFTTITDVTYGASADTVFSYTNIGSRFTETIGAVTNGAYIITASDSIIYTDTLNVAAQTITSAGNVLVEKGIMWRYLKLTLTGDGASAAVELQAIRVKIVKIP